MVLSNPVFPVNTYRSLRVPQYYNTTLQVINVPRVMYCESLTLKNTNEHLNHMVTSLSPNTPATILSLSLIEPIVL